jgi:hypothetical protein
MRALLAAVKFEITSRTLPPPVEICREDRAAARTTYYRVCARHLRRARAEGFRLWTGPLTRLSFRPFLVRIHVAPLPILSVHKTHLFRSYRSRNMRFAITCRPPPASRLGDACATGRLKSPPGGASYSFIETNPGGEFEAEERTRNRARLVHSGGRRTGIPQPVRSI